MTQIREVTAFLEGIAPRALQENYDNAGLLVGDPEAEVEGCLVSLDTTESVVEEAIKEGCNLIISHHPIIFRGLKKLTGKNYVERTVIKAIKNDVAIYAIHTNLDNVVDGVNAKFCEVLGIQNPRILSPRNTSLQKLVTFVPEENTPDVLEAIHKAGAGQIGEYDHCSFAVAGKGRYRPGEGASPHKGSSGNLEEVSENRIEIILSAHLWPSIWSALQSAHPYEEVAYYLSALNNIDSKTGSGMIGELKDPMSRETFIAQVKKAVGTPTIRHTNGGAKTIKSVAVCGGAGSFLIGAAKSAGADAFITSDIKYHEFFDAEDSLLLMDVGHYESEVRTKELVGGLLTEKFNSFAVRLAKTNTNPITYS